MKQLIKLFFITCIFLYGCKKENTDIDLSSEFGKQVENITGVGLVIPALENLVEIQWKCDSWKIDFYSGNSKLSEWNSYKQTIKDKEKLQVYDMGNNLFSVISIQQIETTKYEDLSVFQEYSFYWNSNEGKLTIDGVSLVLRQDGDKLVIFFNTADIAKVGDIFNVTIDNTYGQSLYNEGDVLGIGIITFINYTVFQLAEDVMADYIDRNEIESSIFNTIEVTNEEYSFLFSFPEDGSQVTYKANFKNEPVDLSGITTKRGSRLFESFLNGEVFTFNGVDVIINKISHEDADGEGFLVYAITEESGEKVSFYYNIQTERQHWLTAPGSVDYSNVIIGVWALDTINHVLATSIPNSITYEFKSNGDFIEKDTESIITGAWNLNSGHTELTVTYNIRTDLVSNKTTTINEDFTYEVTFIDNKEMVLFRDWFNDQAILRFHFTRL
ncbi:hypothetical protein [Mariniphaga anaerophila]|nr:hypothetical protein [Mariniphaga anaerophila]